MNFKNRNQVIMLSLAVLMGVMFTGCSDNNVDKTENNIESTTGNNNDGNDGDNAESGTGNSNGDNPGAGAGNGDNSGSSTADDNGDNSDNTIDNPDGESTVDMKLEEIVEKLYEKVDVPPYETITLDKSNFEFFTFIPYEDGLEAVAADALVNITPHSMVIIHSEKGDGMALAKNVAQNADLNKWLCVGSEAGSVVYTDHYVVLIMSEKVTVDAITENFGALAGKLDGMEMSLLPLTNSRYDY